MLSIAEIVDSLRISRSEFQQAFIQVQIELGIPGEVRVGFESITESADDKEAFSIALGEAQIRNWLDNLIRVIVLSGFEDGRLAKAIIEDKAKNNAHLQGVVNKAKGSKNAGAFYLGYGDAQNWTGKVLIKNHTTGRYEFKGSGILIGPNLFLTAWHVVASLFNTAGSSGYHPNNINSGDLVIDFDDFTVRNERTYAWQPQETRRVDVNTKKWCEIFSPCHPQELSRTLPNPLTDLNNFWDYCIIRLAENIGDERRYATLYHEAEVPITNGDVYIFHYQAGLPLNYSDGLIVNTEPPNLNAIPKFRFLHCANTDEGSSGGPCFDKTFTLFGLHQGEWMNSPGGLQANRGIPIVRIHEHYRKNAPMKLESQIWRLSETKGSLPVIGCDDFKEALLKSVLLSLPKFFIISGAKGSGKSFRIEVLDTVLADGNNLKVILNAESLSKMGVVELVTKICDEAGTKIEEIKPLAEINSTAAVWLRDEVLTKVINALNKARNGRVVWLAILDLNKFDIEDENVSEFLLLLYEQLLSKDWLRIVLDGMKGDIPRQLERVIERHNVSPIKIDDIMTYFERFFEEMQITTNFVGLDAFIKVFMTEYVSDVRNDPDLAVKNLIRRIMSLATNLAGR